LLRVLFLRLGSLPANSRSGRENCLLRIARGELYTDMALNGARVALAKAAGLFDNGYRNSSLKCGIMNSVLSLTGAAHRYRRIEDRASVVS
jgi:hypothetical protein